jgi:diacylglycerol kinase family enzyme
VANGQFFGGGLKVAPGADPYDGRFAITVWTGFGAKDFVLKQSMMRDGRHVELAGTRVRSCTTVEASSEKTVLIDCDGEQPGRLPCKMRVLPAAIRLAV